ncbi:MAG TPA: zinc ribbon domain-containing protein [Gemmatimonadota bacterium]|nr:zinc ribbon domain-containing protein [Gemmatimonadota bacterium]
MSGQARVCSACGATGDGNFCARCGQPLTDPGARVTTCPACGTGLDADALYCSECGAPVAAPPTKPLRDRLPWILSGLALVAFAVAISLMIGESVGERAEGMPPTGAVIPSPGQEGMGGGAGPGATGSDPSRIDLSNMSGRDAADRLFDRAMRTEASGDSGQARFFADMGLRAYSGLPPGDIDADARFHIGLLRLMTGDSDGARESADAILAGNPDHLLAWILRINVAEALADEAGLAEARERFRAALASERAAGRPEYAQHSSLIDGQARQVGATP